MNASGRTEALVTPWTGRIVFCLFLGMPLAMPAHIAIHHVTRTNWNWAVSLLYPEVLGTFVVLALAARRVDLGRTWARALRTDPTLRWLVAAAAAFTAWTALSAVVQGAFPGYWIRGLLIGWIVPALLAAGVFALGPRACALAWRGLSVGVALLLVEALALYVVSFGIPRSFHEIVYTNRTSRIWAGFKGGVYFGDLTLGNVNDIGVFFAIALAIAAGYALQPVRRLLTPLLVAFVALALLLEYLCYSRGVILCLLLVLMVLVGAAAGSSAFRRRELGLVVLAFVVFFGAIVSSAEGRRYWAEQFGSSRASTSAFRWLLWTRALDAESLTSYYRGSGPTVMGQMADAAVSDARPAAEPERVAAPPGGPAASPESVAPARPVRRPEPTAVVGTPPVSRPPGPAVMVSKPVVNQAEPAAAPNGQPVGQPKPTVTGATSAARTIRSDVISTIGSSARRLMFGYGLGNYGVVIGGTFDAGTHNMFVDALVASGVPGLAFFGAFWALVLARIGREGWAGLRTPHRRWRDRGVSGPSALLAVIVITGAGVMVNFKFENLGMMLNAAVVWLLILTLPERVGDA